jgi:hypothetical protein
MSTPRSPVRPRRLRHRWTGPEGLPAVDARAHWVHIGVHRLCTVGDGCCRAGRRSGTDRHRCRSEASGAGERTVPRSVDRGCRPTRRDPDVRRGATATLTASSTARQRSCDAPGRVVPGVPPPSGRVPGGPSAVGIRPVFGDGRFSVMLAGVCGRFRLPSPPSRRDRAGGERGVPVRSDQLPGSSGCGTSPSVPVAPRAPAHRWVRTVDVV